VLVESEALWDEARERLAREHGLPWPADAQRAMMGMSSPEWSAYMREEVGLPLAPAAISEAVVAILEGLYAEHLPLIDGAREAVESLAAAWPLGLASSANRPIIDLVLQLSGLRERFVAVASSEEVARGKPAPDVYLEVAHRMGVDPA